MVAPRKVKVAAVLRETPRKGVLDVVAARVLLPRRGSAEVGHHGRVKADRVGEKAYEEVTLKLR